MRLKIKGCFENEKYAKTICLVCMLDYENSLAKRMICVYTHKCSQDMQKLSNNVTQDQECPEWNTNVLLTVYCLLIFKEE